MILNKNIHPERDLYFLGGVFIDYLDNQRDGRVDFFEFYSKMNENNSISMNLFTLVLDWLFLLGTIKKGENGTIEKCF